MKNARGDGEEGIRKIEDTPKPLPDWMLPPGSYHIAREDKRDLEMWEEHAIAQFVSEKMDIQGRGLLSQGYCEIGTEVISRCGWEKFARFLGDEAVRREFLSGESGLSDSENEEPAGGMGAESLAGGINPGQRDDNLVKDHHQSGHNSTGTGLHDFSMEKIEVIDLTRARSRSLSPFVPNLDLTMERNSLPQVPKVSQKEPLSSLKPSHLENSFAGGKKFLDIEQPKNSRAMEIDQNYTHTIVSQDILLLPSLMPAQREVSDALISSKNDLVDQRKYSNGAMVGLIEPDDSYLLNKAAIFDILRGLSPPSPSSVISQTADPDEMKEPIYLSKPGYYRSDSSSSSLSSMEDEVLEVLEKEVVQPISILGKAKTPETAASNMSSTPNGRTPGRKCNQCQRHSPPLNCGKEKPTCAQCAERGSKCTYPKGTPMVPTTQIQAAEQSEEKAEEVDPDSGAESGEENDEESPTTPTPIQKAVPPASKGKEKAKDSSVGSDLAARRCVRCFGLHSHCSKTLPSCLRCSKAGVECVYPAPKNSWGLKKNVPAVLSVVDIVDESEESEESEDDEDFLEVVPQELNDVPSVKGGKGKGKCVTWEDNDTGTSDEFSEGVDSFTPFSEEVRKLRSSTLKTTSPNSGVGEKDTSSENENEDKDIHSPASSSQHRPLRPIIKTTNAPKPLRDRIKPPPRNPQTPQKPQKPKVSNLLHQSPNSTPRYTPRYVVSRIVDSKRAEWTTTAFQRGFYYEVGFKRVGSEEGEEVLKWYALGDLGELGMVAAAFHKREVGKVRPTDEELGRVGFI